MARTGLVYDLVYLQHDTGEHVEKAQRLLSIMEILRSTKVIDQLMLISPRNATREEVGLVHEPGYIDKVIEFSIRGGGTFGGGNIGSAQTFQAALLAVGGVLTAVDAVMNGTVNNAFALVRPPGHHAKPDRGMGFCFFNNVAIAARYAMKKYQLQKILILDWDVHHGNGIQHVFFSEADVLYFSIHRRYAYPGTGWVEDLGEGHGAGYNINVPFHKGTGDADYLIAVRDILVPVVCQYKPELILVSAGQDAYYKDPIGGMNITETGYAALAAAIRDLAREFCGGRLVGALEGGYDPEGLALCTLAIIDQWAELGLTKLSLQDQKLSVSGRKVLLEVINHLTQYWPVLKNNKLV